MIPGTIVQLFVANQMKIFLARTMAIFRPKMAIFRPKIAIFGPFLHLRDSQVPNNLLKLMIPGTIVQRFASYQMKIFLERSIAIFKSKMAIFRPEMAIFGPFWHLRDRMVLNDILKWLILCTIVQLFAADQMKIFLERSMAIFKSKMAIFRPKMAIFGPFLHLRDS